MAGKDGAGLPEMSLKSSATAPNLQSLALDPPKIIEPSGWTGFMRRRGSDFTQSNIHLDIPKPATERKTSLTPEMDKIPIDFINRQSSTGDTPASSGENVPRRGSLFGGLVGLGTTRPGFIMETEEEDFRPPGDLPRRTSMTDAFQWLFKPMNAQPQSQSRHLNVLSPTST